MGRIAQAVGSPVLTSNITQKIFDQLKAARDALSRTGYSVALGCIHRYVGGMASGHHLNSSVSILLALAKDNSSSLVQVCCMNSYLFTVKFGGYKCKQRLSRKHWFWLQLPKSYVFCIDVGT